MADLADIKPTARSVELLHPVHKTPVGLRVFMVPFDDERLARIKRNITNKRLELDARGKRWKAEDIEDNKNHLTFTALLDWEWYDPKPEEERGEGYKPDILTFHGSVPEFNFANFVKVCDELAWVRDQIDEELGDTEAFFDQSKRN